MYYMSDITRVYSHFLTYNNEPALILKKLCTNRIPQKNTMIIQYLCSVKKKKKKMKKKKLIWRVKFSLFYNPNHPQSNKIQQGEVKKMR